MGEEAMFNARVRAMSAAMFDPHFKADFALVRELNSKSPASLRAMAQLLDDALIYVTIDQGATESQQTQRAVQ